MKRKNIKRIIIIVAIILVIVGICIWFGMSRKQSKELENVDAVSFTTSSTGSAGALNVETALDGTEEATTRTVSEDTSVYNKPSTDASVLAYLTSGSEVSVLGAVDGGQWYKVANNGRVAYIQASAVDSDDTQDTDTTGGNRTGTTTNRGNTGTGNTTNTTNTTTQPTVQTPATTEQPTTPTETPTTPSMPQDDTSDQPDDDLTAPEL